MAHGARGGRAHLPLARCKNTFVSRLAENPHVSEETIKALAGHVSKRMLERYSHIRTEAKRAAIRSLEADFR